MAMTWFKFPTEVLRNLRLKHATPDQRWTWVALMCLTAEQEEPGRLVKATSLLAAEVGLKSTAELISTCERLDELQLVEIVSLDASNADLAFPLFSQWQGRELRPSIAVWSKLRSRVFARDGYMCRYCGDNTSPLECDHIKPIIHGGTNRLDNLVTACLSCNRTKGAKTLKEWAR